MSLADDNPGGCYIGFNAAIDRRAAEQLIIAVQMAITQGFSRATICFSSLGGSPDQGFYAYSVLSALPIGLTFHALGNISSTATILFQAATTRVATSYATFYFHLTSRNFSGNLVAMQAAGVMASLTADDARATEVLTDRTGQTRETVWGWHTAERTLTAQEALANGLIDRIGALEIAEGSVFHQVVI